MKKLLFCLLLLSLLSASCSGSPDPDKLLGTWNMAMYLPAAELAKMAEGDVPAGLSMELTMSGTDIIHKGGKQDSQGRFTLRITANGRELALNFLVREAGTWELHGDTFVATTVDAQITPMDEPTRLVVQKTPELQALIAPVKGESVSYKITSLTKSSMNLEMLEPPHFKLTYHR